MDIRRFDVRRRPIHYKLANPHCGKNRRGCVFVSWCVAHEPSVQFFSTKLFILSITAQVGAYNIIIFDYQYILLPENEPLTLL